MTPLITFITFPFYMLETCIRVYEIEPDDKNQMTKSHDLHSFWGNKYQI